MGHRLKDSSIVLSADVDLIEGNSGGNCVVQGGLSEPAMKRFDRDILGQTAPCVYRTSSGQGYIRINDVRKRRKNTTDIT